MFNLYLNIKYSTLSTATSATTESISACLSVFVSPPNSILSSGSGFLEANTLLSLKYRGLDSDLWAIYKNDFDNIGTTLHLVEPDLDTGNIIGQNFLELNNTMRTHMIRYFTTLQATDLVLKALNDLSKGSLEHYPQESIGDYYSFMGKEDKIAVNQKFNSHCKQLP